MEKGREFSPPNHLRGGREWGLGESQIPRNSSRSPGEGDLESSRSLSPLSKSREGGKGAGNVWRRHFPGNLGQEQRQEGGIIFYFFWEGVKFHSGWARVRP